MRHETSKTAATVCRTCWKDQHNVLFCTPLLETGETSKSLSLSPCSDGNGNCSKIPRSSSIVYSMRKWKRERGVIIMKKCGNCQRLFDPVNARNKYCGRCRKKGDRGIRFYHSKQGDGINIGIKVSNLKKRSTILRKEVRNGLEKTRTAQR